jgi:hypothetical protein
MTTTTTTLAGDAAIPPPHDAPQHRRGLRRVVAVALGVLLLAEIGVRVVEDRLPPPPDWYTTEYGIKEEQVAHLAERYGGASVVFLGSSVIDVSIDPHDVSAPVGDGRPAYNAGLIGANLEMVDVWSEHVIEPALHPDVVVISVSSRDVNANGTGLESQTAGFYRLPAVRHLLGRESTVERVERWAGEVSHLVRYRTVLRRPLEALAGYDAPDRNIAMNDELGQELHLTELDYQGGPNVEEFFRREPLANFALSDSQLAALRHMTARLQRNGVRVILLDVPVTQQYIDLHPRGAADYETYQAGIAALARQLGVELVATGIWEQGSFSDPLHLNGKGADALTTLVDGYLASGRVELPAGATPPRTLTGAAPLSPVP